MTDRKPRDAEWYEQADLQEHIGLEQLTMELEKALRQGIEVRMKSREERTVRYHRGKLCCLDRDKGVLQHEDPFGKTRLALDSIFGIRSAKS